MSNNNNNLATSSLREETTGRHESPFKKVPTSPGDLGVTHQRVVAGLESDPVVDDLVVHLVLLFERFPAITEKTGL